MSTQQNNTDVASGHSFADKIGQMVSHVTRTFDFSLNLYHQTRFFRSKTSIKPYLAPRRIPKGE